MFTIEEISNFMFGDGSVMMSVFWLPIIMAAASLASTAIGASKASQESKKNQDEIDRMKRQSDNDYLREYYKGLDSTENRAYLKRIDTRMKRTDAAADNSSVATNATHENALATKQKNNEVYSDAVAGIVAQNENNRRNAQNQYFNRQYTLSGQQININNQRAQNWMNAASGIANAATSLGMAYAMDGGSLFGKSLGGNAVGSGTQSHIKTNAMNNTIANTLPENAKVVKPNGIYPFTPIGG